MKKTKKILAVVLCILMFSAMIPQEILSKISFPNFSLSPKAATSGYYTYTVEDGKATITGCSTSISGNVIIPSTLGGYPVTSIDSFAFKNCTLLTSIVIPDSVISIGQDVCYNCTSLTSVIIGNSVTSIGRFAFYGCSKLTSVTIPDSVNSIGSNAFYDTGYYNNSSNWENDVLYIGNHLIAVKDYISGKYEIKTGTLTIADGAFFDCSSLTTVTIPDSVTSIGISAFSGCSLLTTVTIPDSVTSIGGSAFYNCGLLTSVTIPDSVTSIGNSAFCYCYSLTTVTIGNSVTSIGSSAFQHCSKLTSVIIGNSVTSIGDDAFYNCSSLTTITIPDSVTSIGDDAFSNCSSITSITIPDNVTSIGDEAFYNCSKLASIIIPDSVKSIGNYAFSGCGSLTSITIPDSVTSIGSSAFQYCSKVTSVIIGNSVTSIGDDAFYGCSSLTSVTIGKSVTTIDSYAFGDCRSLTTITIPNSVKSIGSGTFYNCTNLSKVYYCGTEQQWDKISIGSYNSTLTNATRYYHNFVDNGQIKTEATCTQKGEKYSICSICGDEGISEIEINPNNHNYISDGKCEWCNSYIESKHNYIEETDETWVISKEHTASITITFSSDTFVEKDWDFIYIYDVNDNLIGEYTGGELASKSVTVSGNTAKIRLYSDKINTAYGFKVTNIEFECIHNYIAKITMPNCTEKGYTKHTCEHCGDVYYTDEVDGTGHNYSPVITQPTCTEKGYTTYSCEICGDSYVDDYTNATGHKYSYVVKEPTCIEGGFTTYTCVTCGDSYTDSYTNATGVHIFENGNCTWCNGYLESDHNYTDLFDKTWEIYRKGAKSITITFSSDTYVEQRYDYIYIYDVNGNLIGEYTGDTLASKSVTVLGDTVKIQLKTDRSQTYYGFKLTDISAEYITGDLNGDESVDLLDLVKLKKILAGIEDSETTTPDFDNDGDATAKDVVILIEMILAEKKKV